MSPPPANMQPPSPLPRLQPPPPQPQHNGGTAAAAEPRNLGSDQSAVIKQQQVLLVSQAQMVRDLETALGLSPPGPPAVPAPPTGVNLSVLQETQTAAIRIQASYIAQLQAIGALVS